MATRTSGVRPARPLAAPRDPLDDVRARLAAAAPGAVRARPRRLGDRRGLTTAGAVVLVLLLALPALALDALLGGGLGAVFAVAFVAGCTLAALTVHREDLRAAAVMPPLLYLGLALLAGALGGGAGPGGWLQRQVAQLAVALVYQAPVLWVATGTAGAVALWRHRGGGRR